MTWLDSVLRKEYASTRIHIQSVCPMMVKTNMSAIVEDDYPDFMKVTSKTFARQAVRSIGLVSITTGCISHQIQYSILFKLIPGFLMDLMYKYTGNMIRKRAMDKLEQNQPGTSTTGVGEPLIS
jgi:short-subunit dehydrogenase